MATGGPSTVNHKVVAAIDFGTTYTGYAYYIHDEKRNYVDKIRTEQAWPGKVGMQAPTTVLMTPGKTFHSFGFKAEEEYITLALKNKHVDWYYFRHFKMTLHHQKDLTTDMQLKDDKGKMVNALEVFEFTITQIRKHLENLLKDATAMSIEFSQIRWVITVPAIWRDSAKSFMREAAMKGGIQRDSLHLAIEPEAAAIYYKELASKKEKSQELRAFNPKSKYIILDLGGGTVDITVHEVQENGTLKELYAATGNAWGGETVDKAFIDFIENLVTQRVLQSLKNNYIRQWITFCKNFNETKRKFTHDLKISTIENFPPKLVEIYKEEKEVNLALHISKTFKSSEVELVEDVLTLNNSIMMGFFDKSINQICEHVEDILRRLQTNLDFMILVGGFSESPVVTHKIKEKFKDRIKIVLPHGRSSAVLKGAVMYGIDQSIISSRISPYSYGINIQRPYQQGIHPKERKTYHNGRVIVRNAYSEHIRKGQDVHVGRDYGEKNVKKYSLAAGLISKAYMKVYQSTKATPLFCDEKECKNVGTLTLTFPKPLTSRRIVSVWMTCVGTELVAHATSEDPGNTPVVVECQLDFLGNPIESSSDFIEPVD